MSFDIDGTIADMIHAAAAVYAGEWPKVRACAEGVLRQERDALREIAEARIAGDIDDDELKSEIEDERLALEAALLACQVRAKVATQHAVNAALEVLQRAVAAALVL